MEVTFKGKKVDHIRPQFDNHADDLLEFFPFLLGEFAVVSEDIHMPLSFVRIRIDPAKAFRGLARRITHRFPLESLKM